MEPKRTRQHVQHILLTLARMRFERYDVARAIVEHAVDADWRAHASEMRRAARPTLALAHGRRSR